LIAAPTLIVFISVSNDSSPYDRKFSEEDDLVGLKAYMDIPLDVTHYIAQIANVPDTTDDTFMSRIEEIIVCTCASRIINHVTLGINV
jgi:hypothetical protein